MEDVQIQKHGNSKGENISVPKMTTAIQEQLATVSSISGSGKPKSATTLANELNEKTMEQLGVKELPYNLRVHPQDIETMRKKLARQIDRAGGPVGKVLQEIALSPDDTIVQDLILYPDLIIVLALPELFDLLVKIISGYFVKNGDKKFNVNWSYLGIDYTFNMGPFHVLTLVCYHICSTGAKLFSFGAVLFTHKTELVFKKILTALGNLHKDFCKAFMVVTDGEPALHNACAEFFEEALVAYCFWHWKRNLKLVKGVTKDDIKIIFAPVVGLVDRPLAEYETLLNTLSTTARDYWVKNKESKYFECMTLEKRTENGLKVGDKVHRTTTSKNESAHHQLKSHFTEKSELQEFLVQMNRLLRGNLTDWKEACRGIGKMELSEVGKEYFGKKALHPTPLFHFLYHWNYQKTLKMVDSLENAQPQGEQQIRSQNSEAIDDDDVAPVEKTTQIMDHFEQFLGSTNSTKTGPTVGPSFTSKIIRVDDDTIPFPLQLSDKKWDYETLVSYMVACNFEKTSAEYVVQDALQRLKSNAAVLHKGTKFAVESKTNPDTLHYVDFGTGFPKCKNPYCVNKTKMICAHILLCFLTQDYDLTLLLKQASKTLKQAPNFTTITRGAAQIAIKDAGKKASAKAPSGGKRQSGTMLLPDRQKLKQTKKGKMEEDREEDEEEDEEEIPSKNLEPEEEIQDDNDDYIATATFYDSKKSSSMKGFTQCYTCKGNLEETSVLYIRTEKKNSFYYCVSKKCLQDLDLQNWGITPQNPSSKKWSEFTSNFLK
jgi:hypothetical protein